MANNYFQFKKFTIDQSNTAMKVGTDGVLLGAWADVMNAESILDIGTGTGLIAIMLAQRTGDIKIDAVEIDPDAFGQAIENKENTEWSKKTSIFNCSFQDFVIETAKTYDLIVSNPPFFVNALRNPDDKKAMARHSYYLGLDELIDGVEKVLSSSGRFCVIIPSDRAIELEEISNKNGMFVSKRLWIKPTPFKEPKRVLMEIVKKQVSIGEDVLIIEEFGRHGYSMDYINLTKDFYLAF